MKAFGAFNFLYRGQQMTTIFPPRAVAAIQPTNRLHLGNYFGAVTSTMKMEAHCPQENFCFVADYHAQTVIENKEQIQQWTLNLATEFLALGLDPNITTIYRQSDVPEVMEIMWLLSTCMNSTEMSRGHKMQGGGIASAAIYLYPLLMAADILGLKATDVPIGADQNQHLERARDAARRFNKLTKKEIFPIPKAMKSNAAKVLGTDAAKLDTPIKMSKSLDNIIPVFCSDDETADYVNRIVTRPVARKDPIDPESDTIFNLFKLVAKSDQVEEMKKGYEAAEIGYQDAKEILTVAICDHFREARELIKELHNNKKYVLSVLNDGEGRVRQEMKETVGEMKELTGIAAFSRFA